MGLRDKLLTFGEVTGATKATIAYAADILDFKSAVSEGRLDNINVICRAQTANASGDTVAVVLYDSEDGTNYAQIAQSAQKAYKANEPFAMPLPREHRRYLKAGVLPDSTGTFTSTKYDITIEFGEGD